MRRSEEIKSIMEEYHVRADRCNLYFPWYVPADHVKFCASTLRNYFGAIKKNLRKQWDDTDSKLLSVISINGFIIALTRQLSINGVNDFDFYDRIFNGWTIDFSKNGFKYTSSQYRKFSTQILREAFQISDEIIATI